MTTFLRFFILALMPLLGVTSAFGPALVYGIVATLVGMAAGLVIHLTRPRLKEMPVVWSALGTGTVLVTVVDLLVSWLLPQLRAAWGLYLNLLPFLPLLVLVPLDRAASPLPGTEVLKALKTGLLLTLMLSITGLVREVLGQGSLTLIPDLGHTSIPGLNTGVLSIVSTGAGGFFLAAAAVVAFRTLRPKIGSLALATEQWGTGEVETTPVPAAVVAPPPPLATPAPAPAATPAAKPEPTGEWGESLASAVAALPAGEKNRLLVIGSGNGELTYYLSMLCLQQAKSSPDKEFTFRVRGVDHFSTRVEAAVRGVYRDHQIEFIAPALRQAYLVKSDDKYSWKVGSEPRLHVQFEVADFQNGQVFFPQPAHLIVLNQGIEYVTDEKKASLLATVCSNLVSGGALVVTGGFKRELLPEGMKRTGTTVFRRV